MESEILVIKRVKNSDDWIVYRLSIFLGDSKGPPTDVRNEQL